MIAPARAAAVAALVDLASGRGDLPHGVARLRQQVADRRDAALAAEIVTGTFRWRARIDALLAGASTQSLDKLPVAVLAVLRAAVFQLEHLDRVPTHAVVNEAVAQVRALKQPALAGYANAILRRIADPRRRPALPAHVGVEASLEAQVADLSINGSHPEWLVRRWIARMGFELAAACVAFNNERPGITVRVHRERLTRDAFMQQLEAHGVDATACRYASDGVTVASNAHLDAIAALDGAYSIQEEGSQLVAAACGVAPGHRVLDVCASPGGKTLALASAAGANGLIVAGDYRAKRVALLARTVRTSAVHVHVVRHDAGFGLPFDQTFDRVVVDAPCSGLGTLRRDPDVKWTRREEDLAVFAARQVRMLEVAAEAVASGGHLIYATCSSEPDENESVVTAFLARDHRFARAGLPASLLDTLLGATLQSPEGFLSTSPATHGLEGFFAAVLARQG